MRKHRNPRPSLPKRPTTDNPTRNPPPHIAALRELAVNGWYISEIKPDRTAPVLWRLSMRRYDSNASISVADGDFDAALAELLRYAAVDAEEP